MGETTEMILEGVLCETCGSFIGEAVGFPVKCNDCEEEKFEKQMNEMMEDWKEEAPEEIKFECHYCGVSGEESILLQYPYKTFYKDVHYYNESAEKHSFSCLKCVVEDHNPENWLDDTE